MPCLADQLKLYAFAQGSIAVIATKQKMDTAIELKIGIDNGEQFSDKEILDKLQKSELVAELTSELPDKPIALVWRLICISEIPFSNKLDYNQNLIDIVYENLQTPCYIGLEKSVFLDKKESEWTTHIIKQAMLK